MTTTPQSGYELTFEARGDYLYAFVTGPEDTLEITKAFWTEVHSQAMALGLRKILVEEDFPNQLFAIEMYYVGKYLTELFTPEFKIAHVDRSLSDLHLNRYGESMAEDAGIDAGVFNRIEDALDWLNG